MTTTRRIGRFDRAEGVPGAPAIHLVARFSLVKADVETFERYEAGVLPLLPEHGGTLLHRLRAVDGSCEFHVLSFRGAADREAYMADQRRIAMAGVLAASGAAVEVVACDMVGTPSAER